MTKRELIEAMSHIPDEAEIECSTKYFGDGEIAENDPIWFGIVSVEHMDWRREIPPEEQHYLIILTDQPTMD